MLDNGWAPDGSSVYVNAFCKIVISKGVEASNANFFLDVGS